MKTLKKPIRRIPAKPLRLPPDGQMLGMSADDTLEIVRQVQAGFPFQRLARFQKASALPWETMARFVAIPQRTLTRRQSSGRLAPDESDRVWRASRIFDLAVALCEGDTSAARQWLLTPQVGLGGALPLEFAATEVGAREVENLIGRLEHGVFA
ncbi:MAG: antitoxin Xre/MbcA/ParS toxin-binding domain-containing protein [Phycisphaerae bacterium]